MEHKSTKRRKSSSRRKSPGREKINMSQLELARLGGGEVAYIRPMTTEEAMKLYPTVKGLPRGLDLFALHAADGTPLALTDSLQAAIGHALGDKLAVASLH